jgi:hypothetical protein
MSNLFSNETADRQNVYVRRLVAGGREVYTRKPFDLVKYEGDSTTYLEPVSALGYGIDAKQWDDTSPRDTAAAFLIVDAPPFREVQEFR